MSGAGTVMSARMRSSPQPAMDTAQWSMEDLDRFRTVQQYTDGALGAAAAADHLGVSTRQLRRLRRAVEHDGPDGLLHGNRNRHPVNRKRERLRNRIRSLLTSRYAGLPPQHAWERLTERHGITVSNEWLRQFMVAESLWVPRSRRRMPIHRTWRPRRSVYGDMLQADGSYHRWFEDRAPEACLLAAIDDATSRVPAAAFVDHEGVIPVFSFWKTYVAAHGKPLSVYVDRFSTYRHPNRGKVAEDPDLATQFERAMRELGIHVIHAWSPQAKGRVERLFGTLQHRLVAELRMGGISDAAEANRFLAEQFLPDHRKRFSVEPERTGDAHRVLTRTERTTLDAVFSVQETRVIRNDFTIAFRNRWYQIRPTPRMAIRPEETVTVEVRLDGSVFLRLRGTYLRHDVLPRRPAHRDPESAPWVLTPQTERRR